MTTDQPIELPDVRDYRIQIPIANQDGPLGDLYARVPAPSPEAARFVGEMIAVALRRKGAFAERAGSPPPAPYTVDTGTITTEDVDDQPSPDTMARVYGDAVTEAAHFRRVLAGLAAKLPGLLQLTEDEYKAADPDGLTSMRMPGADAMMFVVPSTFGEPADQQVNVPGPAPTTPAEHPDLLPGHDVVPARTLVGDDLNMQIAMSGSWYAVTSASHGPGLVEFDGITGMTYTFAPDTDLAVRERQPVLAGEAEDPDVRRILPVKLPKYAGRVDVLHQCRWRKLEAAAVSPSGVVVTMCLAQVGENWLLADDPSLMTVRPTSWVVPAGDLVKDEYVGKQVLLPGGWYTLSGTRPIDDMWLFLTVTDTNGETLDVGVEHVDEYEVRDAPQGWN